MSAFNLEESVARAEERLAGGAAGSRRKDAGALRVPAAVLARLRPLLLGQEKPRLSEVQRALAESLEGKGLRVPARATLRSAFERIDGHVYRIPELPSHVRDALYNLDPEGSVPGHQLVFYALQYGTLRAVSYAAGLPWLDLYQAARLGGWRPQSRGLLDAALLVRGIE